MGYPAAYGAGHADSKSRYLTQDIVLFRLQFPTFHGLELDSRYISYYTGAILDANEKNTNITQKTQSLKPPASSLRRPCLKMETDLPGKQISTA